MCSRCGNRRTTRHVWPRGAARKSTTDAQRHRQGVQHNQRLRLCRARRRGNIFVYIPAVKQSGLTGLADNQAVEFDLIEGRDGRQMAGNLRKSG